MIEGDNIIAIIPARAGSKRLPGKNTRILCGKPLITWTIEAAKRSKYVDHIVVTTDDEETALISKNAGADVPFIRPANLSTDSATSVAVVNHVIDYYDRHDMVFQYALLLQPTSPLRCNTHIDNAINLLLQNNAVGVTSVSEIDQPHKWSGVLSENLLMDDFFKDENATHALNGAIYMNKIPESRIFQELIPKSGCTAYVMESSKSVDIDTFEDFELAENTLRKILQ